MMRECSLATRISMLIFLSRSTSRCISAIPEFLALGTYFGEISSHCVCMLDRLSVWSSMAIDFDAISSVIMILSFCSWFSIGTSWCWIAVLLFMIDSWSFNRCFLLLNALLIVLGLAILMNGFGLWAVCCCCCILGCWFCCCCGWYLGKFWYARSLVCFGGWW